MEWRADRGETVGPANRPEPHMDDPLVFSIVPRPEGARSVGTEADDLAAPSPPAAGPPRLTRIPARAGHPIVMVPVGTGERLAA